MYLRENFGKKWFSLGVFCLFLLFFKFQMHFSEHDVSSLKSCPHILNAVLPLLLNLNNIV